MIVKVSLSYTLGTTTFFHYNEIVSKTENEQVQMNRIKREFKIQRIPVPGIKYTL